MGNVGTLTSKRPCGCEECMRIVFSGNVQAWLTKVPHTHQLIKPPKDRTQNSERTDGH